MTEPKPTNKFDVKVKNKHCHDRVPVKVCNDVEVHGKVKIKGTVITNISGSIVQISGQSVLVDISGIVINISGIIINISGAIVQISGQDVFTNSGSVTSVSGNVTSVGDTVVAGFVQVTSTSGGTTLSSGPIIHVTLTNPFSDMYIGPSTGVNSGMGYILTAGMATSPEIRVNNLNAINVFATVSGQFVSFIGVR